MVIKPAYGFTMIEVLVVIALLGILLGIGIPAYRSMVAEQNVRGAAVSLHGALLLARSEAVKLNRRVTLRPATGEDWSQGWLVENPADTADADALHRDRIPTETVTVTSDADEVVFRPSGRTTTGDVTFELEADRDTDKKRCVSIGLDGRPTTVSGGCP